VPMAEEDEFEAAYESESSPEQVPEIHEQDSVCAQKGVPDSLLFEEVPVVSVHRRESVEASIRPLNSSSLSRLSWRPRPVARLPTPCVSGHRAPVTYAARPIRPPRPLLKRCRPLPVAPAVSTVGGWILGSQQIRPPLPKLSTIAPWHRAIGCRPATRMAGRPLLARPAMRIRNFAQTLKSPVPHTLTKSSGFRTGQPHLKRAIQKQQAFRESRAPLENPKALISAAPKLAQKSGVGSSLEPTPNIPHAATVGTSTSKCHDIPSAERLRTRDTDQHGRRASISSRRKAKRHKRGRSEGQSRGSSASSVRRSKVKKRKRKEKKEKKEKERKHRRTSHRVPEVEISDGVHRDVMEHQTSQRSLHRQSAERNEIPKRTDNERSTRRAPVNEVAHADVHQLDRRFKASGCERGAKHSLLAREPLKIDIVTASTIAARSRGQQ